MLLGMGEGNKSRNLSQRDGSPGGRRAWAGRKFTRNDTELGMAMKLKEKCGGHIVGEGEVTAEGEARHESMRPYCGKLK